MKSAVLLLSSGLDSAANLALAGSAGFSVKLALTIDYGQHGARKEVEHARILAKHYQIEHQVFDLRGFSALVSAKSALLSQENIPRPSDLDAMNVISETAKAVWVPNRNAVLLSIAAAAAESRGFDSVAVGFNREEAVTFPDNSENYMNAITESFKYSTRNQVEVLSATVKLDKTEIVKSLAVKKFPFEYLWSCYRAGSGTNGEFHCGECESCLRLKRALKQGLDEVKFIEVARKVFGT